MSYQLQTKAGKTLYALRKQIPKPMFSKLYRKNPRTYWYGSILLLSAVYTGKADKERRNLGIDTNSRQIRYG